MTIAKTAGVLALVAGGLVASPAMSAREAGTVCGQRVSRVLARGHGAVVYVFKTKQGVPITRLCDRGRKQSLDGGIAFYRVQWASVDITPTSIGYAAQDCDDVSPTFACRTQIRSRGRIGKHSKYLTYADDPTPIRSVVSRLRVGPTGAVAWISCHAGNGGGEPQVTVGARCRTSVHRHYVYVHPPDTDLGHEKQVTLLQAATGIDPRTLTVGAKRVTWRYHGRLRSAPIPASSLDG